MNRGTLEFTLILSLVFGLITLPSLISPANAGIFGNDKPKISPTKARSREVYYPNSENLAPDEMRVIA